MRHYGHNTVSEMTQTLLHSVCGDDLLDWEREIIITFLLCYFFVIII